MPRETRARDQVIAEAKVLLESQLLKDTMTILKDRAVSEMLRATEPHQLIRARDFANAIEGVLPAIEGQLHEAEAAQRADAASDAA